MRPCLFLLLVLCGVRAFAQEGSFSGSRAGEEQAFSALKIPFCWCPAGKFRMGSPESEWKHQDNEKQVDVTLSHGFWIGQTEITQAQWVQLLDTKPWHCESFDRDRLAIPDQDNLPAVWIQFDEATKFCEKLNSQEARSGKLPKGWQYRLPTEAEWEYACRAGSQTVYCFGDQPADLQKYALYLSQLPATRQAPDPVKAKRPNAWGIYDMHGNVMEWCADFYRFELPGGTDPHVSIPPDVKRTQYLLRVYRGGNFLRSEIYARSAYRSRLAPEARDRTLGFRVVLSKVQIQ